jgi:hypothetical protein
MVSPRTASRSNLNLPITEQVRPTHRSWRLLLLRRRDHGSHCTGIQGRRLDLGLQLLDGLG